MSGPGHLVAGRYRLLERIGGGGMGAIWLASDERLGRRVAVKQVLPPPTADETVIAQQRQRALREGRIAARLSHPHAVAVYDVALEDGAPWLVMEYLPSRSLAEVLHEDGVLPVDQVAQIGAQVADALAATHAAGIVHRDVKPANVLIGRGPRVEGLVKITDFGISHARDDVTLTQTGQITGTPAFLAPEVARGGEVVPESDVFSLGATLYTCLEGQPPFGMDDNALRLLHRVAGGQVIPPRRAGSLTGALTRMMAADPADRPTMTEVRDELARLAVGRDGDPTTVLMARTRLGSSGNRERTREMGTGVLPAAGAGAAAASAAPDPGTAVQDVPAGPPGWAGPPRRPERRRGPVLAALLLLAVLLAGGGAFWLSTRGDAGTSADAPGPSSPPADDTSPAAEERVPQPESPTPDTPDSPEAGPTPSATEEAPTSEPSSDGPEQVVEDTLDRYYGLLPDDPDAAYDLTGPFLRSQASPGYFRDFWEPWAEVELRGVRGVRQDEAGVITATTEVRFTGEDGREQTERHQVRLVQDDDGNWLVDLDLVA
ncbi:protein kinase domain-containing protein [Geodermatophilus sp. URMC 61]|uniref:protein kinase domain-containing protein n=1 Tax=Geodermatophilus sp. URMC 61 TaxID=3423411 RepID=UPI00406D100B